MKWNRWFSFGLIVIALIIFSVIWNVEPKLSDEERVEEILTRKGYEYVSSGLYYNGWAYLTMKDYKERTTYQVLSGLQTLYRVYPNAINYGIETEVKGQVCTHFFDGDEYRDWVEFYENPYWLVNQINETRKCYGGKNNE